MVRLQLKIIRYQKGKQDIFILGTSILRKTKLVCIQKLDINKITGIVIKSNGIPESLCGFSLSLSDVYVYQANLQSIRHIYALLLGNVH